MGNDNNCHRTTIVAMVMLYDTADDDDADEDGDDDDLNNQRQRQLKLGTGAQY